MSGKNWVVKWGTAQKEGRKTNSRTPTNHRLEQKNKYEDFPVTGKNYGKPPGPPHGGVGPFGSFLGLKMWIKRKTMFEDKSRRRKRNQVTHHVVCQWVFTFLLSPCKQSRWIANEELVLLNISNWRVKLMWEFQHFLWERRRIIGSGTPSTYSFHWDWLKTSRTWFLI